MTAPNRIVLAFCRGLILAVIAGLMTAAVTHDFELLRASPNKTGAYPVMIYGTYTMPGIGVAGADFADIYMSAKALHHGESAYRASTAAFADPFGRPKNYPPLMYWFYVPLSQLAFWPALIVHTVFSLLAVFGASAFVLWQAGYRRHIAYVLLAQASLFFLTPIGVTHFERGQFDLLVAAIVALCFACSFVKRKLLVLAVATGIAGALKWTSLPFVFCFAAFGFLLSSGRRRWAFFLLPSTTLLATVVFWNSLREYWASIRYFDVDATPFGVTLRHFLPGIQVKLAPVVLTLALCLLVWLRARSASERYVLFVNTSAPMALVLTNLAVCFPAVSYEYHTVTTLGMLPCLVVWTLKAGVPNSLKAVTCALYGIFLVVAYRILDQFTVLSPLQMTQVYVLFIALFFALGALCALSRRTVAALAS